MKILTLTHPGSDQTIEVTDTAALRYLEAGWRPATPKAPSAAAPKHDWVEFAVAQGFNRDDAEAKTKNELREALS